MRAAVSNVAYLIDAPASAAREIKSRLTLRNPEYEQRVRQNASTEDHPAVIHFYHEVGDAITVPRGAVGIAKAAAHRAGEQLVCENHTLLRPTSQINFTGNLRLYQLGAAAEVLRRWSNVLHVPTGAGKTITALWLVAERAQRTLVIVPTEKLLTQWLGDIEQFLQLPSPVGIIGGGKCTIGEHLTVGIIDSVAPRIKELQGHWGHIIVDECHRVPGKRYRETVAACHARYLLGLTATPIRNDGLDPLINWLLGPTITVPRGPLVEMGAILPAEIEQRTTEFETELSASDDYAAVLYEVLANQDRNRQIVADTVELYREWPGVTLLLTDHRGHVGLLAAYLKLQGIDCAKLVGGIGKRKEKFYQDALADGRIRVIAATAKLVGEGWNFPGVGAMQLTAPIKFSGKLIQAIGRALRPFPGMDHALIKDYVDHKVPQLMASARARARTYRTEIAQWHGN